MTSISVRVMLCWGNVVGDDGGFGSARCQPCVAMQAFEGNGKRTNNCNAARITDCYN